MRGGPFSFFTVAALSKLRLAFPGSPDYSVRPWFHRLAISVSCRHC